MWRRYDLAVIAETGDRPHFYGALAAARRVGLLPPSALARWWKAPLLADSAAFAPNQRRIDGYARLAAAMSLPFIAEVIAPTAGASAATWRARLGFDTERERYAVVNVSPRFRYKRWHLRGWRDLFGGCISAACGSSSPAAARRRSATTCAKCSR